MQTLIFFRSFRFILPRVLVQLFFFVLACLLLAHFGASFSSDIVFFLLSLLACLFLLSLIKNYYLLRGVRYEISETHIGKKMTSIMPKLLSCRIKGGHMALDIIYGSELKQSLLERLLNIGTISVGTSTTGEAELHLEGLYEPRRYLELINERAHRAYEKRRQADPDYESAWRD